MIDHPVTIITGAGSGVGRAASILLSELGHRLVLAGRRRDALEETVTLLSDDAVKNERVLIQPTDVSDLAQCDALVEQAAGRWDRIDALVNNAGGVTMAMLEETTGELLQRTFAVNVFGPARLIAQCWPIFQSQGSGCVVNVSTMGTADPFPGLSAYAAAKCALESYTRSIMNERGEANIASYSVAPGAIETPMVRGLFSEERLPKSKTLDPMKVAEVIEECVRGERPDDAGGVIRLPSP